MTKLTQTVVEKAVDAKDAVKFSLYDAFEGILTICIISFIMWVTAVIVIDTDVQVASGSFWSTIALVVSSLFAFLKSMKNK